MKGSRQILFSHNYRHELDPNPPVPFEFRSLNAFKNNLGDANNFHRVR